MIALLNPSVAEGKRSRKEQAQGHFDRAEVYYRQANFREALAEYRKAHELRPHSSLIFNMAQCHRQLGEHRKALFMYRLFLTERPDAPNKAEVNLWIAELEKEMARQEAAEKHKGRVTVVSTPEGAEVLVDQFEGTPLGTTPVVLRLEEGTHLIVLKKKGYKTIHKNVTVKARDLVTVKFTLPGLTDEPATDGPLTEKPVEDSIVEKEVMDPGPDVTDEMIVETTPYKPVHKRWWFWTGTAAAAALGITGTVTGVMTLRTHNRWKENYDPGDRDRGKTLRTLTDVFLGTAILTAAGVTAGALIVHFGGKNRGDRHAVVAPGCGATGCGVFATGSF